MKHAYRICLTVAAAAAILAGCAPREEMEEWSLRETTSPAGTGSAQSNLFAGAEAAYLSWLEPSGEGRHALRFAVWQDGRWSDARTVAEGADYFVNWADFPSLVALPDGRLAAHWLVRSGTSPYAYDVHLAQSTDGGASWSEAVIPHRDGTQTEHGFVSLFPAEEGRLAALWLDGRNFATQEDHADHGAGPDMTLRATTLEADGRLGPEILIDPRVCDCCQTSVALTSRGPLAVYRDRTDDEIRDISVVRYLDGAWTAPEPVHRDGWRIPGCPVNGPAAAASGERVAVAWFTAAADTPRVLLAFSDDAGASFSPPLRVDAGDPVGRADVILLPDGEALVSWVERAGDDAEIRLRRVAAGGMQGPARLLSESSAARASGFPRMARVGSEILFTWTEAGEPTRVRTAVAVVP